MKKINLLLIAAVILFGTIGCDVAKNLNIAEVESLHIQCDANQDVNFGGEFTGRVVANLRSGKSVVAPREKGTAIVFPSFINHRITKITKGTRRSIVGWITGPPYR
jgi:predicted 2-oxoglutarate/Fe(II)-dependent dioxygenase YbiX